MSEIAIELMDSNGNGKMDKREFGGWKGLEDLIQVFFNFFVQPSRARSVYPLTSPSRKKKCGSALTHRLFGKDRYFLN